MWQDLERRIRNIASNRWNCNATTETIAGVKCDCVLKPQPDEWIIVEITEESSLEKVRTDIAKLVTVKQSLFMNNVFLLFCHEKYTYRFHESCRRCSENICPLCRRISK